MAPSTPRLTDRAAAATTTGLLALMCGPAASAPLGSAPAPHTSVPAPRTAPVAAAKQPGYALLGKKAAAAKPAAAKPAAAHTAAVVPAPRTALSSGARVAAARTVRSEAPSLRVLDGLS